MSNRTGYSKQYYQKNKKEIAKKRKRFRQKNKAKIKKRSHEYYLKHKKQIVRKQKRYRKENKQVEKERHQIYYKKNKRKLLKKGKKFRREHKDWYNRYNRRYNRKNRAKRCKQRRTPQRRYTSARNQAKVRRISFRLSFKQYADLISKPCYYCKISLSPFSGIGLDRINNKAGYFLKNVLPCCGQCNLVRNALFTVKETQIMIQALLRYRKSKA